MGIFSHFIKTLLKLGLNAFAHTECSWNTKRKTSSEFLQGEQTIISFNDFCKIKVQFLKTLFSSNVVIHFHPGHSWPKTLNSFTELV